MRRNDLILAAENVLKALDESNLSEEIVKAFTPSSERGDLKALLRSHQTYSIYAHSFSKNEVNILRQFGLESLDSPETLNSLLFPQKESSVATRNLLNRISNFRTFLPKFLKLIRQEGVDALKIPVAERSGDLKNKEILTLVLPENKNEKSSPQRLVKALESIDAFYQACSLTCGSDGTGLAVLALDSGSDKSFDFTGASAIIKCVKETLFELWDRVVFFREKRTQQQLTVIGETLTVYTRVLELEKNGSLSREETEIFKRSIIEAADAFISAGAIIPEFKEIAVQDPRKLMAPEPRLLAERNDSQPNQESPKVPPPPGQEEQNTEESEKLTDEERAEFERLSKKRKS